ncbi:MAG: ATP-binding protein, partial [Planctomycetota bacterium]
PAPRAPRTCPEPAASASRELERARDETRLARDSLDVSDDCVLWIDESGTILDANASAERRLGDSGGGLKGRAIFEIDRNVRADRWNEHWSAFLDEGRWSADSTHVDASGREFPVELRAHLVRRDGEPMQCLIARDVTRARRIDEAIRAVAAGSGRRDAEVFLGELCRSIVDALGSPYVGIAMAEDDGSHARVVSSWSNGAPGEPARYALRGTPCADVMAHGACFYGSGVASRYPEDTMLLDWGVECYAGVRLDDARGRPIGLIMAHDTSAREDRREVMALLGLFGARVSSELERDATERVLRASRDAAESANRLKSSFIANVSHEIRTPMTAIKGYAEMLSDAGDAALDSEERVRAAGIIGRNCDHLLTILNDVLDVSKLEAGKMVLDAAAFDPARTVGEVIALLQHRASSKGLSLTLEVDPDVPSRMTSDETRVRQIVTNLIGNAIKFTERGGIGVLLTREGRPDGGSDLVIEVSDTGVGLSPENVERLLRFETFFQTDATVTRRHGGSGLGLHICDALARQLGGGLSIESTLGVGSRFTARIEARGVVQEEASSARPIRVVRPVRPIVPAEVDESDSAPKPLNGLRILLVDDGDDNRRLIEFVLKRAGAIVETGVNGVEGMERVRARLSSGERHHVVLMDMQMPVMDGYEATRRIVAMEGAPPVIAITAHTGPGEEARSLAAGCVSCQPKPIDRTGLIAACLEWSMRGAVRRSA